jgi:hypothetical protein
MGVKLASDYQHRIVDIDFEYPLKGETTGVIQVSSQPGDAARDVVRIERGFHNRKPGRMKEMA